MAVDADLVRRDRGALAVADARLTIEQTAGAGIVFGSGFGTIAESGPHFLKWTGNRRRRVTPDDDSVVDVERPAAQIAIYLGLKGPSLVVSTACSSGSHALGLAYREIREGGAT